MSFKISQDLARFTLIALARFLQVNSFKNLVRISQGLSRILEVKYFKNLKERSQESCKNLSRSFKNLGGKIFQELEKSLLRIL